MALGGAGALLTEDFGLGLLGVQVAVILFTVAAFCVIVPTLGSFVGQSHPAHKLFDRFLDGCCLFAIVPAILGVWDLTDYLLSLIGWPVVS